MHGAEGSEHLRRKKMKFEEVKEKYPKVFSLNNKDIGCTELVTMDIDTGDSPPVCQKPYTLPLKHYNCVQQEMETLECAGVIRKSIIPWASPIVIVFKKSTQGQPPHRRMCIDFRKLNDLQPKVHCADSQTGGNISLVPLPKINEMYGRLKGGKYFTTLDLQSGYYHISLSENSKAKTAFVTPFCKYQFEVVSFGLAQAPAYFQQLISMVLQDCSEFAMAYLDNIIIFSRNECEHLKHIKIIFQKLIDTGLKMKESKCDFFKKEIHYLGHLISLEGIHPLPEKLDTICNMPRPKIISLVHKCLHDNAPPYLQRLIQHTRPTRTGLQSEEDTTRLLVPRTSRKTFASRSFSVLGPQLWNDLPRNLHRIDNYASFKKELKTYLFKVAFLGHKPSN